MAQIVPSRVDFHPALRYSRFRKAMWVTEISFGQTASHSYSLEQLPNPSASMAFARAKTRLWCSGLPCGNMPRCFAFAETKSIADAFLQEATQAPQPMQAAASIASSAVS